jgi:response regulator RpfG family c-di-GMP phosphodiesterase
MAKEIARYHHENGMAPATPTGSPATRSRLPARLMALADVFDALIASASTKSRSPSKRPVSIIREGRGTHFDPDIVDAFLYDGRTSSRRSRSATPTARRTVAAQLDRLKGASPSVAKAHTAVG